MRSERGINGLTGWLREIHHVLEYQLNVGKEPLLKAGEKRGIGDFFELTELPQFFAEAKEEDGR